MRRRLSLGIYSFGMLPTEFFTIVSALRYDIAVFTYKAMCSEVFGGNGSLWDLAINLSNLLYMLECCHVSVVRHGLDVLPAWVVGNDANGDLQPDVVPIGWETITEMPERAVRLLERIICLNHKAKALYL